MELYNKIKDLEDFLDREENIIAIKNIQEKIKNHTIQDMLKIQI